MTELEALRIQHKLVSESVSAKNQAQSIEQSIKDCVPDYVPPEVKKSGCLVAALPILSIVFFVVAGIAAMSLGGYTEGESGHNLFILLRNIGLGGGGGFAALAILFGVLRLANSKAQDSRMSKKYDKTLTNYYASAEVSKKKKQVAELQAQGARQLAEARKYCDVGVSAKYLELEILNIMVSYFEDKRVSNLSDAVNLYVREEKDEKHRKTMQQLAEQQVRQAEQAAYAMEQMRDDVHWASGAEAWENIQNNKKSK